MIEIHRSIIDITYFIGDRMAAKGAATGQFLKRLSRGQYFGVVHRRLTDRGEALCDLLGNKDREGAAMFAQVARNGTFVPFDQIAVFWTLLARCYR
jgi:hypothetical protein